jgi:CDP-diglyceride synthetase
LKQDMTPDSPAKTWRHNMMGVLLAVVAGAVFGRWLGSVQQPKPVPQKVRVADLRRSVQTRR